MLSYSYFSVSCTQKPSPAIHNFSQRGSTGPEATFHASSDAQKTNYLQLSLGVACTFRHSGCWELQRVLSRVQTCSDSWDHSKQHGLGCPKRGWSEGCRISAQNLSVGQFRGEESWSELRNCLKLPWNAAWTLKSESGVWGRQSEDFAVTILFKKGGFPELDYQMFSGWYIYEDMCATWQSGDPTSPAEGHGESEWRPMEMAAPFPYSQDRSRALDGPAGGIWQQGHCDRCAGGWGHKCAVGAGAFHKPGHDSWKT